MIVFCSQHNDAGKVIACHIQFDGSHIPGQACKCFVPAGPLSCPIDDHRVRFILETQDWSDQPQHQPGGPPVADEWTEEDFEELHRNMVRHAKVRERIASINRQRRASR